ncbi:MAG TPA: aldo/keto reductase [Puia sp.]|jgi:aryl-alcohol dehydrogenase-like predicted oxidoreductase|nr:aldo/keto reductase [Puia sp.]
MSTNVSFRKEFTLGDDLTVRRMGFGAMRITGQGIWGPPKDHDEAIRVLRRAVELGVNFIDTADSYGPDVSEELIAEALYPYPKGLVIATKGGFLRSGPNQWHINSSPDHLKEALEGSLARLRLDRIDVYQLHRIDPTVPFEETLSFLQGVQEEGLIKHVGLSEVGVEDIKKAEEYVEVVSVQNKYSQDFRKWEPVLEYCEQTGKAFIPWNPLNAGKLENMTKIESVAGRLGVTPHQLALAWLLYHSPNNLLIPGTSSVRHLEENMDAGKIELNEELLEELS